MLFLNLFPFSLRINALAHSICTFLYLPYTCQIQKKEHSKMTWLQIPFDFYRKHTWASLYPILQAFLRRATYPSLPAKNMKDLLGKAALDHTSFYHSLRHTCFLFNSTLNCDSSFTASQRQSNKECLEAVALDHTTFHHSTVSTFFLITLQVEIHVNFPY